MRPKRVRQLILTFRQTFPERGSHLPWKLIFLSSDNIYGLSMQLKANTELQNGKFRIIRVLGQGGFGITYLAENTFFDRFVAIKEFFPKDFCGRDATSHLTLGTQNNAETVSRLKARFLKEAKNIAKLDHPGIVKIHDIFEENGTAYYVMDYIEGENLNEMVKRNGPLPEAKAVEYIRKVGDALEYIHSRNMTHFDVKPANIVVRRSDDMPILIDFGLSKQYDTHGDATSTLMQGISHGYSPIEMYNAGSVSTFSPQTDVYSLGATLYYVLTGKAPLPATELVDASMEIPAGISSESRDAIKNAMRLSKSTRTQSVKELKEALSATDSSKVAASAPEKEEVEQTLLVEPVAPVASVPKRSSEDKVSTDEVKPETSSQPSPAPKKKSTVLGWTVGIMGLIVLVVVLAISSGKKEIPEHVEVTADVVEKVTDLGWDSPLGFAVYSGEVMSDTLANGTIKKIPNGRGVAVIKSGKFQGSKYDGEFKGGVLEGKTVYTLSNGDTFVGTFQNNEYERGKYTDKASGEYFEGSFVNGQPADGIWYDKTGKPL